jgi:threonine/homoserine/homoserine lactone efflux protein
MNSDGGSIAMMNYLITGGILGLSAGFSPGPLLALVISETLRYDIKAGVTVALAPILTDLPIIFLSLFILAKLSAFHTVLGVISLSGGFLLVHMGYESIRIKGVALSLQPDPPDSLKRGILVNVLSPYPYLFWIGVGAPTTLKALNQSTVAALSFILGFYILLVGSKIFLAILVGKSRSFLTDKLYIAIMRILGATLLVFAVFLFRDGLKAMKLL